MMLTLAGRRSRIREAAHEPTARYATLRSYDENGACLALTATVVSSIVLICCAIVLRG